MNDYILWIINARRGKLTPVPSYVVSETTWIVPDWAERVLFPS